MKIKIAISIQIGDERYLFEDTSEVESRACNDVEEYVSNLLSVMEHKAQSAINPCFWDHDIAKEFKNVSE